MAGAKNGSQYREWLDTPPSPILSIILIFKILLGRPCWCPLILNYINS